MPKTNLSVSIYLFSVLCCIIWYYFEVYNTLVLAALHRIKFIGGKTVASCAARILLVGYPVTSYLSIVSSIL